MVMPALVAKIRRGLSTRGIEKLHLTTAKVVITQAVVYALVTGGMFIYSLRKV